MLTPRRVLALLIVLTAVIYAPSVGFGFVYEDRNDFRTWAAPGSLTDWALAIWEKPARSLTALSYMAGQSLSGVEPWGYHLMSVGWHLVNGVLVAILAAAVVGGGWAAPIVAGVFLLHPVQVESVAYISSHAELVSTACLLLALICVEHGRLALAFVCCGVAMLGKETAVAAFLLVPAWQWFRGRGLEKAWIALMILPVLGLWPRFPPSLELAWIARTVTEAIGLLSLWLLPVPLTIDHDWSSVRIGVSLGVIVALSVWNAPARFAVVCAAALLLPRLLVPQLEGLHEHHLYPVSVGLSLCAGFWLCGGDAQEDVYVPRVSPLPPLPL